MILHHVLAFGLCFTCVVAATRWLGAMRSANSVDVETSSEKETCENLSRLLGKPTLGKERPHGMIGYPIGKYAHWKATSAN